jgi:cytochrome c biogenesis protein CcdA
MARYKSLVISAIILIGLVSNLSGFSQESVEGDSSICAVYLTGIGCHNCAITDPLILSKLLYEYENLIVIEYEIFKSASVNQKPSTEYFKNYLPGKRPGVPFFLLDKDLKASGSIEVSKAEQLLKKKKVNRCPLPSGQAKFFNNLDLSSLPGKVKIWHKDRVLISEEGGADSNSLKKLLTLTDPHLILKEGEAETVEPKAVLISEGEINFKNAVKIDGWIFQWGQKEIVKDKTARQPDKKLTQSVFDPKKRGVYSDYLLFLKREIAVKDFYIGIEALVILILILLLFRKKVSLLFSKNKQEFKNLVIIISLVVAVGLIFILAKNIPTGFLKNFSSQVPLPVFTFTIALIDGFNPCNLFVLTLLLALLISASGSKKRVYLIGFIFIFVVFVFYFFFMVAWLNIFKYFNLFASIRAVIGSIAVLAGLVNCKDFFFFKKGMSLTIGDNQKGRLTKKMNKIRKIAERGSIFMLILSSVGLAVFSSFIELPCTAGFPIIFTTILAGETAKATSSYYLWILFYNLIYVLPLAIIVAIFGYTFQAKRISQKQIKIIKLIGGVIMVALGLILIVNPQILGITL